MGKGKMLLERNFQPHNVNLFLGKCVDADVRLNVPLIVHALYAIYRRKDVGQFKVKLSAMHHRTSKYRIISA